MTSILSPRLTHRLVTQRLTLEPVSVDFAYQLLDFQLDNRTHLRPWEPLRRTDFFTLDAMTARTRTMADSIAAGSALHWLMFERGRDAVIGECNFTSIVRGPFLACHLGYAIDHRREGQGLMREALTASIEYVFERIGLHRIMASYRPENLRSERLLNVLGFEREGFARAYLKINGVWADHVLTALINPAV
ncbi:GNAT family N-acetyltransferase [Trinickia acidisoli]|uniref:GNAT family N-acetyltransferase n=1 Tax=Trinickia acidisoli TaxID=2767482 RepID=UPI001A8DB68F|nr:GNAT family N-acetyltransferase [Trinickia acidisoli]